MKLVIKEYWENLKTEYETAYKVSIFSDYNVLMQYAEHFGSYLRGLMQEHPLDVDVVCAGYRTKRVGTLIPIIER